MKKNKRIFIIFFLISVLVIFFILKMLKTNRFDENKNKSLESGGRLSLIIPEINDDSGDENINENNIHKKSELPEPSQLKEEVNENPHQTPEGLIQYAGEIGEKLEKALSSPKLADALMDELLECVESSRVHRSQSLEVFCLKQSSKLAQKYKYFEDSFQAALRGASEETKKSYQFSIGQ